MFRKCVGILLASILLVGCEFDIAEVPKNPSHTAGQTAAQRTANPQPLFPSAAPKATAKRAESHPPFVTGFAHGYQLATDSGKPMLVFFTAEWCHFCHQMADEAFSNQQVLGLADQFVCILVDADAEPEVCKKFRVQGYPTVQFLSARGIPLNRLVGKKPSGELMMAMQTALQNIARAQEDAATKQR